MGVTRGPVLHTHVGQIAKAVETRRERPKMQPLADAMRNSSTTNRSVEGGNLGTARAPEWVLETRCRPLDPVPWHIHQTWPKRWILARSIRRPQAPPLPR